MADHILAIDQGTTSTWAIVFDASLKVVGVSQQEFRQIYPRSGWVEYDPEDLWRTADETSHAALKIAGVAPRDVAGIGIANQRETTIVWDRATGKPIHNGIVWQDRRTADLCTQLRAEGTESDVAAKTLLISTES